LGIIAFKRGNLRESEDYLRASIEADQREGNYSDLGALYTQMGQYDEAEKNLKKAIEINRNDMAAHIELGNLYLQTERVKEAVREFRRAAWRYGSRTRQ
jgi:tetratricopeptide (TPR) repeat protein